MTADLVVGAREREEKPLSESHGGQRGDVARSADVDKDPDEVLVGIGCVVLGVPVKDRLSFS